MRTELSLGTMSYTYAPLNDSVFTSGSGTFATHPLWLVARGVIFLRWRHGGGNNNGDNNNMKRKSDEVLRLA